MSLIIVEGHKIETKDIFDIHEIEKYKKMFLNREAGFVIKMIGGKEHRFCQTIPYESYPSEISDIKDKWEKLRNKVVEQWEADKTELKVFKL